MSKEKTTEQKAEAKVTENQITDFKRFEYGDLFIKCSQCNSDLKFKDGIRGGLRIELPTTDKHEIILECAKCKNKLSMYWKESDNIDELRLKDTELIHARLQEIDKQKEQLQQQLNIVAETPLTPDEAIEPESDEAISKETAMSDEAAKEIN